MEFSNDERRDDYLQRLERASELARWVCAADKLHNASSILADLRRTIDPHTIWSRFNGGRDGTVRFYRRVADRLSEIGFRGEIMQELEGVVAELEAWSRSEAAAAR